jgi:hypothetical protein
VSDLDPEYKVVPGEFVLDERFVVLVDLCIPWWVYVNVYFYLSYSVLLSEG